MWKIYGGLDRGDLSKKKVKLEIVNDSTIYGHSGNEGGRISNEGGNDGGKIDGDGGKTPKN